MSLNEYEEKFIELMKDGNLVSMLGRNDRIEVTMAAKQIESAISCMVNNFGFNKRKMADAIMQNPSCIESMNYLAMAFVKRLADNTEKWMYDERNRESIEKAIQICNMAPDAVSAILNENSSDDEVKHLLDVVADTVANQMHRTLQQTFAGFCFYILHRWREEKRPHYEALLASMSDTFYNCWMI